jgi:hypothetical protein
MSLMDITMRIQSNITLSENEIVLCLQLNIMLPPPVPGKRAIPDTVEKKLRQTFFFIRSDLFPVFFIIIYVKGITILSLSIRCA